MITNDKNIQHMSVVCMNWSVKVHFKNTKIQLSVAVAAEIPLWFHSTKLDTTKPAFLWCELTLAVSEQTENHTPLFLCGLQTLCSFVNSQNSQSSASWLRPCVSESVLATVVGKEAGATLSYSGRGEGGSRLWRAMTDEHGGWRCDNVKVKTWELLKE